MINIWTHLKFFRPFLPSVLGWLRPWSCDQKCEYFSSRK